MIFFRCPSNLCLVLKLDIALYSNIHRQCHFLSVLTVRWRPNEQTKEKKCALLGQLRIKNNKCYSSLARLNNLWEAESSFLTNFQVSKKYWPSYYSHFSNSTGCFFAFWLLFWTLPHHENWPGLWLFCRLIICTLCVGRPVFGSTWHVFWIEEFSRDLIIKIYKTKFCSLLRTFSGKVLLLSGILKEFSRSV